MVRVTSAVLQSVALYIYTFRAFGWMLLITLKSYLSETFGFALLTRKTSMS